jgi:peroxiredoxin
MDTLVQVGKSAPDFSLPGLEGISHRLSDQRGMIVVLNFWSATCPWAQVADETIAAIDVLQDERIVLWPIASNVDETPEQIRDVAGERGLPIVLLDAGHSVADMYEAVTTPHVFVIDSEGVLRYRGSLDDTSFRQSSPTKNYLADAVSALLEGRDPTPAETPGYGCAIVRHAV